MAGTKDVAKILVVVGMLIGIAHEEAYGMARGQSLEYAAQQFHLVSLLPGGDQSTLPRPATIEFALYEVHIDLNAGRHAIDDSANGGAVALSERRQAKYMAE
jgi:hypothetical protein